MLNINEVDTVYLAYGFTDLRKSIDGLSVFIKSHLKLDPFEKALFVFCNRQMNKLKTLHFDESETSSDLKAPEPTIEQVTYQRKNHRKIQEKKIT